MPLHMKSSVKESVMESHIEQTFWEIGDVPVRFVAKRIFDVGFSLFLLCLLSPVLLLIALIVKLSSRGPVLYWDVRVGQNGCLFRMPKFRTMFKNADQLKKHLLEHNEMKGPVFKMKEDPRVTAFGYFLRKHSLDELPQFLSVLQGHMSVVGPRPPLLVKPGVTCLWQVMGRNKITEFDDWVRMDLYYIKNWSLRLDLKIVLKTVGAVIKGTGL